LSEERYARHSGLFFIVSNFSKRLYLRIYSLKNLKKCAPF
jgi:hypothetical protein